MNSGKTILAQILGGLSSEEFARCARRYPTCRETPALSAYDHFATMVFAQLTYRESLRDIDVGALFVEAEHGAVGQHGEVGVRARARIEGLVYRQVLPSSRLSLIERFSRLPRPAGISRPDASRASVWGAE